MRRGRSMRTMVSSMSWLLGVAAAAGIALTSLGSLGFATKLAQAPAAMPEMTENCPGLIAGVAPSLRPAGFRVAALNPDQVRITYAGHSTFLIESPRLVRMATDYNDY